MPFNINSMYDYTYKLILVILSLIE